MNRLRSFKFFRHNDEAEFGLTCRGIVFILRDQKTGK
jgi:hypothetical protein